jgi:predicted P-loop ATPase
MDTLKWDTTQRIETFFIDCAGSPDNEYVRAASRNFFISMAARIYQPGCKVDNMIILEGPQGKLKSTLLSAIGEQWHCESTEQIHSKDFLQALRGKLITEFADLSNWPKDDMDILKKTITCRIDRYRPSYGRISQDFPRMSVFAGTTNSSLYLSDETGARRFWPIKTNNINIPRAKQEREQLFAEAVHLFESNASWWEMPESTTAEQELRRQVDVWEDILSEKLKLTNEVLPLRLAEFLDIPKKDITKSQQMRIGRIMRKIGWEPKDVREDGRILRKWFRGINKSETPEVPTEW